MTNSKEYLIEYNNRPGVAERRRDYQTQYNRNKGHKAMTKAQRAAKAISCLSSPQSIKARTLTALSKGELYHHALVWKLVSPSGVKYNFKNLDSFIRNNIHVFAVDQFSGRSWRQISASIHLLSPRNTRCKETIYGWRWDFDGSKEARK